MNKDAEDIQSQRNILLQDTNKDAQDRGIGKGVRELVHLQR